MSEGASPYLAIGALTLICRQEPRKISDVLPQLGVQLPAFSILLYDANLISYAKSTKILVK